MFNLMDLVFAFMGGVLFTWFLVFMNMRNVDIERLLSLLASVGALFCIWLRHHT